MYKNIFYVFCIAAIALSCGKAHNPEAVSLSDITAEGAPNKHEPGIPQEQNTISISDTATVDGFTKKRILQSGGPVNIDWDKKIIKTGKVTLELKDYNAYNNTLHEKLKGYGAYVAQEQQTESDYQIANSITIKVPVDRFDDLMNSLSGDGVKVLEKNISTQDVTGEVVDTKSRIEAKKEVRAKYIELLRQAKKMDEILQVQNEINSIQLDIESATGRINYLGHSASYSTIIINYYQYLNGGSSKDTEPGFLANLTEAFKTGGSIISNLLLFFISIWPLSVAAACIFIYYKRLKLKKA